MNIGLFKPQKRKKGKTRPAPISQKGRSNSAPAF